MKAPVIFPYFGGKRRVSRHIWQALGHCDNFIEPFFGSGAVLFNRPQGRIPWPPKGETINDLDGYIVNVWRSIQAAPELVAAEIERLGPSQELTMHAVNAELIAKREGFSERMRGDRRAFDAELAACWVWGACQWIGSGWASVAKLPRPHLSNFGQGLHSLAHRDNPCGVIAWLSRRLRHVRMLCGDWSRCLTDSAMTFSTTGAVQGIMLDPPYSHAMRDKSLYAQEMACADAVAEWCREHGDDKHLRIVLCGIAGEHSMPSGWRYLDGKLHKGYQGSTNGKTERLLFSPHCLPVDGELPVDPSQPVRRRQRSIYDLLDPTTTAPAPIPTDTQQDNHGPHERPQPEREQGHQ